MKRLTPILLLLASAAGLAASVSYSYDKAGRLTKADYGDAGSISYTYDNSGNLLSRVVVTGIPATGTAAPSAQSRTPKAVDRPIPEAAAEPKAEPKKK